MFMAAFLFFNLMFSSLVYQSSLILPYRKGFFKDVYRLQLTNTVYRGTNCSRGNTLSIQGQGGLILKVILSRKGFDSSNGGCPSPIMPDNTLLSFPIPSDDGVSYDELGYRPSCAQSGPRQPNRCRIQITDRRLFR